ncbi:MAG: CbiX/SirB N-terminal domain-containing protein [Desulfamplus sp.]|nr:CbiX/SirB N-terminal domain-containing protein [Desulfamplus sp.]
MRAMILLAHGSRKKESAQEVEEMAKELENQALKKGQFDIVKPAFMQFCEPNFYQVVDELIKNHSKNIADTEVVVLPYFISAGSHVSEDIPNLIQQAQIKYPQLAFRVTPHLGKFQGLTKLILEER